MCKSVIRRVFIDVPDLELVKRGSSWKATIRIGLASQLRTLIADVKEIHYTFHETCGAKNSDLLRPSSRQARWFKIDRFHSQRFPQASALS